MGLEQDKKKVAEEPEEEETAPAELSVRELKERLSARWVDFSHCIEKHELKDMEVRTRNRCVPENVVEGFADVAGLDVQTYACVVGAKRDSAPDSPQNIVLSVRMDMLHNLPEVMCHILSFSMAGFMAWCLASSQLSRLTCVMVIACTSLLYSRVYAAQMHASIERIISRMPKVLRRQVTRILQWSAKLPEWRPSRFQAFWLPFCVLFLCAACQISPWILLVGQIYTTYVWMNFAFDHVGPTRDRTDHAQIVAQTMGEARCYCPNFVHKSDCRNCQCRGEASVCTKWADPPTTTSCWRYSYKWHLKRRRNGQRAIMLRILVDGEMGEGQIIEAQMAAELGVEVKEIQVNRWTSKEEVLKKIESLGWA